jgi:hypothetical protein
MKSLYFRRRKLNIGINAGWIGEMKTWRSDVGKEKGESFRPRWNVLGEARGQGCQG